ncbi:MAG TPA: 16S rRNA (cytosine(1402)-N(4))-methyltransferase RsmH [Candidatus Kaiserbacteria bacterium]|nr:16S rRNA (cytosine(1402)-N(4))-methyltransferase RsmH [Candidatus Kaiserbacteria bacterium]
MKTFHHSVLSDEVISSLSIHSDDVVVDATVGGAGHFARMGKMLGENGTVIGIDADGSALQRAREYLPDIRAHTLLVQDNFRNLSDILDKNGISHIDKSLFDLGWSGFQLSVQRGFSFQETEPLLMTYDEHATYTAAHMVNSSTEEELVDILRTYGEERFARSIARSITHQRKIAKILTTADLVEAVLGGTPGWYHKRKIHPATKTFQAFRIAINDELNALREGITSAMSYTRAGGIIAVITFHSIEDRIVKNVFRDAVYEGRGVLVTRKPIVPSAEELSANRRARSAKLRVFAMGSRATMKNPSATQYTYA